MKCPRCGFNQSAQAACAKCGTSLATPRPATAARPRPVRAPGPTASGPREALRRVGLVLIVVGVADIAYMAYCVANGVASSSSLNVFALVAGILLYRGSLRAARVSAHAAGLALGAALVAPLAIGLLFPVRLALVTAKTSPASSALAVVVFLFLVALALWVYRQLTSDAVTNALERPLRAAWSVVGGALLTLVIALVVAKMLRGPAAETVLTEARQQLGPDYEYFVSEMTQTSSANGDLVRATVLAYTSERIEPILVRCEGAGPSARCASRWRGSTKREPESAEADPGATVVASPEANPVAAPQGTAVAATEAAPQAAPGPETADTLSPGHESFRKGEFRAAVAAYGAAIERDPLNNEAHYWRGVAFTKLGDREQALKDFDSCIARGDDNIEVYVQAEWLLVQRSDWSRIVDMWSSFIGRNPGSGRAYYGRGGSLLRTGETERALRDAEESCRLGYQPGCQAFERVKSRTGR